MDLLDGPLRRGEGFGSKARVSVWGMLNGFPYRSSIFSMDDGTHIMMVNKAMQKGAGVASGHTVKVIMEPDTGPRVVRVPADLKKAFAKNQHAKAAFQEFAYSHRNDFVEWIEQAKKTRPGRGASRRQ